MTDSEEVGVLHELLGTELDGRFKLVRLLGAGGFGTVFVADEYVAGHFVRQVALKVIPSHPQENEERIVELKAAVTLDHPCIVRCHSVGYCPLPVPGTRAKGLYLVMEAGGGSLLDRVRSVPFSVDEAAELCYEVASALHHLHVRRLIHRDVKPGNIIRVGNRWKLSDFGLVRYIGAERIVREASPGTLCYMPPESFLGEQSFAWDLWSLGVSLIEAMSGDLPFDATDRTALIRRIAQANPRLPRDLRYPLDEILNGCLAKDPKIRITAAQVLDLLEHAGVAAPRPRATTTDVVVGSPDGVSTIAEALRTARPGDRILVKPGVYREHLVIDRSAELLGEGTADEVVIDGDGRCCLLIQAGQALLRGLTFRTVPCEGTRGNAVAAVEIDRGRSVIERCRILSGLQAAVSIRGSTTAPIIRGCHIAGGRDAAIHVLDRAKPFVEACRVVRSGRTGVWSSDGADPTVRDCEIADGKLRGVFVAETGRGTFSGCRIAGNAGPGIEIARNARPFVQCCIVRGNRGAGVDIAKGAKGAVLECDLRGNEGGPWTIARGTNRVTRVGNQE